MMHPEKIKIKQRDNRSEKEITRREALKKISAIFGAAVIGSGIDKAVALARDWGKKLRMTPEETKDAYNKFIETRERREDRIRRGGGGNKYYASYENKRIEVPENFINSMISHLEEARKKGYWDHLFFGDLNHCHAGLPKDHFKKEYNGLNEIEIRAKSLSDPRLMHLYHSREFLIHNNPLRKNRNFIGYFDGRPIKLIHPQIKNSAHTVKDYEKGENMKQYDGYQPIKGLAIFFRSDKNGLFELEDGTRLDIGI